MFIAYLNMRKICNIENNIYLVKDNMLMEILL